MQFREDFGGLDMATALSRMTEDMKRRAVRVAVRKAGTVLAKEIRREIKSRDMPYSRMHNAKAKRRSKDRGAVPLALAIRTRYWAKPSRGIIGTVVGAAWDLKAYHSHLVELGHRITGHRNQPGIRRQGERTVAHHFQRDASEKSKHRIYDEIRSAVASWIRKQNRPPKMRTR